MKRLIGLILLLVFVSTTIASTVLCPAFAATQYADGLFTTIATPRADQLFTARNLDADAWLQRGNMDVAVFMTILLTDLYEAKWNGAAVTLFCPDASEPAIVVGKYGVANMLIFYYRTADGKYIQGFYCPETSDGESFTTLNIQTDNYEDARDYVQSQSVKGSPVIELSGLKMIMAFYDTINMIL